MPPLAPPTVRAVHLTSSPLGRLSLFSPQVRPLTRLDAAVHRPIQARQLRTPPPPPFPILTELEQALKALRVDITPREVHLAPIYPYLALYITPI